MAPSNFLVDLASSLSKMHADVPISAASIAFQAFAGKTAVPIALQYVLMVSILLFLTSKLFGIFAGIVKYISDTLISIETIRSKTSWLGVSPSRSNYCSGVRLDIKNINRFEAWHDKYFTDLEAEVEADGEYYESWLHRLFRRRTSGRRKVKRLVDAIKTSAEKRILLVGEPGSGKSVAVRHLAMEVAREASRKRKGFLVPIYINLRGMPTAPPGGPTADTIREFVRKEIGKTVDAANYVEDHWVEYIERGHWFFIFDSFDEIPDVLHTRSHSAVIDQYAEAIRAFAESKPKCHAVVASRPYKGPTHLDWKKFKILPLSVERQETLILRSGQEGRKEAQRIRRYVASTDSPVYRNPMFLTLLCQAMRAGAPAPQSDYDLLRKHVSNLIERGVRVGAEHLRFDVTDLTDAALQIAQVLACNDELGLAPTFDELALFLRGTPLDVSRLDELLAALVFVKVLRTDVAHAARGDRRFEFFHRRYQEALVVEQITNGRLQVPEALLLTEPQWREYAVMLIQSQSDSVVQPTLDAACVLVKQLAAEVPLDQTETVLGFGTHFKLEESAFLALLRLLQDALRFRPSLRPTRLAREIGNQLEEFWATGDLVNKHTVLTVSGLIPQNRLEDRIREVVREPSIRMNQEAFEKTAFLSHLSDDLGKWLRKTLANLVLDARRRADLRRIEVSVSWMPQNSGAAVVWRRCMGLYEPVNAICVAARPVGKALHVVKKVSTLAQRSHVRNDSESTEIERRPLFKFVMMMGLVAVAAASAALFGEFLTTKKMGWMPFSGVAFFGLLFLRWSFRYVFRAASEPLVPARFPRLILDWHRREKHRYSRMARSFAAFLALLFVAAAVTGALLYASQIWFHNPLIALGILYAIAVLLVGAAIIGSKAKQIRSLRRFDRLVSTAAGTPTDSLTLLTMAADMLEARCWAKYRAHMLFPTDSDRRAFANWLVSPSQPNDWRAQVRVENLRRFAWELAERLFVTY